MRSIAPTSHHDSFRELLHAGSGSFKPRGLGLSMLLVSTLLALLASPTDACTKPVEPPDDCSVGMWIGIQGNQYRIIVRDLVTFDAGPDQFCACGLQQVPGIATVTSAQLVRTSNGAVLPGFSFTANSSTSQGFEGVAQGNWTGFFSPLSRQINAGTPVDLVFRGTLSPGTTFSSLRAQLRQAGMVVGTDEANPSGSLSTSHLALCVPDVIDPTTFPSSAPLGALREMNSETRSLTLMLSDPEQGLDTVEVLTAEGAAVVVPDFLPSTTESVAVTIRMVGESAQANVRIEACNTVGGCATFTSLARMLELGEEGFLDQEMTALEPGLRRLHVRNGKPGLRMVAAWVDGSRLAVRPLRALQELDFDLSLAMGEGESSLSLAVRGAPGATAMVVLTDGS